MTTQSNFISKQFARVGKILPSPFERQIIGSQLRINTNQGNHISKL